MPSLRPTGGAASRQVRAVAPSAEEMLGAFYGLGPRGVAGMQKITDVANPFQAAPTAAQSAEFGEFKEIIGLKSTMQYFKSDSNQTQYNNMAGLSTDQSYPRQWEDVTNGEDNPTIPGMVGEQNDEDTTPAPLTVVPTSTSNPDRPRTVAAGYDENEEKITVVFRDGTFYNYYEVTPSEWAAFKSRVSKGQYIYKYLDFKPRGPADVSTVSQTARRIFYKYSRASQIQAGGSKIRELKQPRGR